MDGLRTIGIREHYLIAAPDHVVRTKPYLENYIHHVNLSYDLHQIEINIKGLSWSTVISKG
jgi:hypothetical protein